MAKKTRSTIRTKNKQASPRRLPWLWLVIGVAVLLIAGGLSLIWASSSPGSATAPEITGAPRLAVEQTLIDEGEVKVNTPVRTAFRLRNIGDRPLYILDEPGVKLVEGC